MKVYARFGEILSKTLKDLKDTKRYGQTDKRTDNMKTVYPPTNTFCGGYKNSSLSLVDITNVDLHVYMK